MEIQYFNRGNQNVEVEKVYGDAGVKWLYQSSLGKFLSAPLVKAPISVLYGALQSFPISRLKVQGFIKNFDIKMEEFLPEEGQTGADSYSSFNAFFIRKFREGARRINMAKNIMPAFSEARYFGYESITDDKLIPVKGRFLNAKELLANSKWEGTFTDGPLLLARLCPVDYHRFHFPDDGKVLDHYKVGGLYHSVNPIALKEKQDIFSTNIREVTIMETENFGKLAYVEVGAICVGRIEQSTDLTDFKRGEEKGYFLFGGSTVIVIGEKGKWSPSQDILEYTEKGMETYIQLGDEVGLSK
ncbi:phosphatidylserine decarboxylase [Halobacteriovorax marinus]|uniref:phosphatidylserine decarboxylase n=1 Tax=Halobacteriovorax marinus TaxID=97084 RepID=UPI003A94765C